MSHTHTHTQIETRGSCCLRLSVLNCYHWRWISTIPSTWLKIQSCYVYFLLYLNSYKYIDFLSFFWRMFALHIFVFSLFTFIFFFNFTCFVFMVCRWVRSSPGSSRSDLKIQFNLIDFYRATATFRTSIQMIASLLPVFSVWNSDTHVSHWDLMLPCSQ